MSFFPPPHYIRFRSNFVDDVYLQLYGLIVLLKSPQVLYFVKIVNIWQVFDFSDILVT